MYLQPLDQVVSVLCSVDFWLIAYRGTCLLTMATKWATSTVFTVHIHWPPYFIFSRFCYTGMYSVWEIDFNFKELGACANTVYHTLSPPPLHKRLGTRLVIILNLVCLCMVRCLVPGVYYNCWFSIWPAVWYVNPWLSGIVIQTQLNGACLSAWWQFNYVSQIALEVQQVSCFIDKGIAEVAEGTWDWVGGGAPMMVHAYERTH